MIRFADKNILEFIDVKAPSFWVATWFGSGLIKPAPGTWGTVGALFMGVPLVYFTGATGLFVAFLLLLFIGTWASDRFSEATATKDLSHIVIDEVVGLFIALMPALMSIWSIAAAFLLFRFFDVLKPWPISYLEKNIPKGWGVMLDDVVAGIFAALVMLALRYAGVF